MHFRFEQSWFLLLLLALPLIWFCQRRMKSPSLQFGPARVFQNGLKSAGLNRPLAPKTLFYTAIASPILGFAPPPFRTTSPPSPASGLECLLFLGPAPSVFSG